MTEIKYFISLQLIAFGADFTMISSCVLIFLFAHALKGDHFIWIFFASKILAFSEVKIQISKLKTNSNSNLGSGRSTAEERLPRSREVVVLNPAGCWAFFSSLPSH